MRMIKAKDYADLSRKAANILAAQVYLKPNCVLGLATGSTPIGTYKCLVEDYNNGNLDFSEVKSANLDEYCGLDETNDQSYRYFMNDNLFNHVNIDKANTNVPNGKAEDLEAECARYDALIEELGGVDIQLLGIGHNGHIGFNEPGTPFDIKTHIVTLKESTRKDNARFFDNDINQVPTHAITMGIATIMKSNKVLLVATGENKADAVKAMIEGAPSVDCPASALQNHKDVVVILDTAAASKLTK